MGRDRDLRGDRRGEAMIATGWRSPTWREARAWLAVNDPGPSPQVALGDSAEAIAVSNLLRYLDERRLRLADVALVSTPSEYKRWRNGHARVEPTTHQRRESRRLCRVTEYVPGRRKPRVRTIIVYTKEKP
jgi:hypothetical protein